MHEETGVQPSVSASYIQNSARSVDPVELDPDPDPTLEKNRIRIRTTKKSDVDPTLKRNRIRIRPSKNNRILIRPSTLDERVCLSVTKSLINVFWFSLYNSK